MFWIIVAVILSGSCAFEINLDITSTQEYYLFENTVVNFTCSSESPIYYVIHKYVIIVLNLNIVRIQENIMKKYYVIVMNFFIIIQLMKPL